MTNNGHNWEREYIELKRRYDSLVKAVRRLEERYSALESENEFHKTQLANAELNIVQQKQTLISSITVANQTKDDMATEVAELRAKIKRLENGDNNRLGN
jgi:predicted  nucleic acid-binding Zn-ribbon protein